jgi:hypothetical protein
MKSFFKDLLKVRRDTLIPKEERKSVGYVTLVGLVISFLSTTFSQAEDMGI